MTVVTITIFEKKMSQAARPQGLHWCFTINNPSSATDDALRSIPVDYMIVGKEICPTTSTPHYQGYLKLKTKARLSALKKLLPTAHLELRKGTVAQAIDYCKKEGDYAETGNVPEEQTSKATAVRKREFEVAFDLAKRDLVDQIEPEMQIKYLKTLKALADDHRAPCTEAADTTGVWIWGPPGVGKSRYARDTYPDLYLKLANKWWDHYGGESHVLLEDLDPKTTEYLTHHLKLWTDRYPFKAEYKGGAKDIRPDTIIITSNFSPEECFPNHSDLLAIRRRCKVIHMTTPFKQPERL